MIYLIRDKFVLEKECVVNNYTNRILASVSIIFLIIIVLIINATVGPSSPLFFPHFDVGLILFFVGVFIGWGENILRSK